MHTDACFHPCFIPGHNRVLGRPPSCAREPIKGPPSAMRDRQDEDAVAVRLKGHQVRKTRHHPSAYGFRPSADARPQWKRLWSGRNPFQKLSHPGHELTTEARALFVVPQSCGPEFSAGFRMKNDPHAAARVPSESALARCPSPRAGPGPQRFHVNDAPIRSPMLPRPARRALRDSTGLLRQRGRVPCEEVAAPGQGVLLLT